MSNEEIKADCDKQYGQIADARKRLEEIRAVCKHEQTFEGTYSYRIGVLMPAIICYFCGELINYK
jgi:hypothetical protein